MRQEQGSAKIAALAVCSYINVLFYGLKIIIPIKPYALSTASDRLCAGNTPGQKANRGTSHVATILLMPERAL
jgi:hypothetical protein